MARPPRQHCPHRLFYRSAPPLSRIRIFGCKGYILRPTGRKFSIISGRVVGYLLGLSPTSHNFMMWIPSSRQVISVRDVVFLEQALIRSIQGGNTPKGIERSKKTANSTPKSVEREVEFDVSSDNESIASEVLATSISPPVEDTNPSSTDQEVNKSHEPRYNEIDPNIVYLHLQEDLRSIKT